MASLNEMIAGGQICCSLRAKTMFYQVEGLEQSGDPSVAESRTYGNLWCSRTQSLFGPDGQTVDLEQCRPGRGCCETA
ncbi:MAG TPA: hypothetical protein VGQ11_03225 [Candidatus Acidoferrales bacterium]|jgi:hypothetical protein|nr:hypothetical protein [Candidatus Acidoferrales bacterium]